MNSSDDSTQPMEGSRPGTPELETTHPEGLSLRAPLSIALWSLRIPMTTIVSINLLFLFASFAMPSDRDRRGIVEGAPTYPIGTAQAALRIAQIVTNLLAIVYCFWDHPRRWRGTLPQGRQMAAVGLLVLYIYFVMLGAYRLWRGHLDKTSQIMDWVQEVMNALMIVILVFELRLQRREQERRMQAQEILERTPRVVYYQPNMSHPGFGPGDELPKYEERDEASGHYPVVIDMANLNRAQSDGDSPAYEANIRAPERPMLRDSLEQAAQPPQTPQSTCE